MHPNIGSRELLEISNISPQALPQPAVPFLRTLLHTAVAPLKIGVVDKHANLAQKLELNMLKRDALTPLVHSVLGSQSLNLAQFMTRYFCLVLDRI